MTGTPGTGAMGSPWLSVQIDDITGNIASVTDQFGKQRSVRTDYQRAKGIRPRVGEKWVIDRSLGFWTFACTLEDYGLDRLLKFTAVNDSLTPDAGHCTWFVPNYLGTAEVVVTLRLLSTGAVISPGTTPALTISNTLFVYGPITSSIPIAAGTYGLVAIG